MTSPLWASVSSVEAASQGGARLVLPGTPGAGGPGPLGGDPTTYKRTWGPAPGVLPHGPYLSPGGVWLDQWCGSDAAGPLWGLAELRGPDRSAGAPVPHRGPPAQPPATVTGLQVPIWLQLLPIQPPHVSLPSAPRSFIPGKLTPLSLSPPPAQSLVITEWGQGKDLGAMVGPWVPPETFNRLEMLHHGSDLVSFPTNPNSMLLTRPPKHIVQHCFIVLLRCLKMLKIIQPGVLETRGHKSQEVESEQCQTLPS